MVQARKEKEPGEGGRVVNPPTRQRARNKRIVADTIPEQEYWSALGRGEVELPNPPQLESIDPLPPLPEPRPLAELIATPPATDVDDVGADVPTLPPVPPPSTAASLAEALSDEPDPFADIVEDAVPTPQATSEPAPNTAPADEAAAVPAPLEFAAIPISEVAELASGPSTDPAMAVVAAPIDTTSDDDGIDIDIFGVPSGVEDEPADDGPNTERRMRVLPGSEAAGLLAGIRHTIQAERPATLRVPLGEVSEPADAEPPPPPAVPTDMAPPVVPGGPPALPPVPEAPQAPPDFFSFSDPPANPDADIAPVVTRSAAIPASLTKTVERPAEEPKRRRPWLAIALSAAVVVGAGVVAVQAFSGDETEPLAPSTQAWADQAETAAAAAASLVPSATNTAAEPAAIMPAAAAEPVAVAEATPALEAEAALEVATEAALEIMVDDEPALEIAPEPDDAAPALEIAPEPDDAAPALEILPEPEDAAPAVEVAEAEPPSGALPIAKTYPVDEPGAKAAPVAKTKSVATAEPKPVAKSEPTRVAKSAPKPAAKSEPNPAAKPVAKSEPEAKPVAKAEPRPAPKVDPSPVATPDPKPDATPEPVAAAPAKPEGPKQFASGKDFYRTARKIHNRDPVEALILYKRAAAEGYAKAYKQIGVLRMQLGDKPRAIAAYRKYLRLNPGATDTNMVQSLIDQLSGR